MSIIASRTNENSRMAFIYEKCYSCFYRIQSLVIGESLKATFRMTIFYLDFHFHNYFLYLFRTVNLHTWTVNILRVKYRKHSCFNNHLGGFS